MMSLENDMINKEMKSDSLLRYSTALQQNIHGQIPKKFVFIMEW